MGSKFSKSTKTNSDQQTASQQNLRRNEARSAQNTTKENDSNSSSNQETLILELLLRLAQTNIEGTASLESHDCICDYCGRKDFTEYRFKCLICKNYDLCGKCFEKRRINKEHELEHAMLRFDAPNEVFGKRITNTENFDLNYVKEMFKNDVHTTNRCDGCLSENIKGCRFKCDTCNDYDLCLSCYLEKKESKAHKYEHPMILAQLNSSLEFEMKDIDLLEELGKGAFGSVYKARLKPLNKIVACKIISLSKRNMNSRVELLYKSYKQELEAYRELKGVNILRMIGNSLNETSDEFQLIILTEFMPKGSLTSLLEREGGSLSYRRRFDIACDIAAGTVRIHELGFIHRDIRPDNILISENYTAKIGDMGIAKFMNEENNTQIGCQNYMPPEFHLGKYDQKLDVFTVGLTLNELFNGQHKMLLFIPIIKQADTLNKIINKCVEIDPDDRPDSKELLKVLLVYKKVLDHLIFKENVAPNYIRMPKNAKDQIFCLIVNRLTEFIENT